MDAALAAKTAGLAAAVSFVATWAAMAITKRTGALDVPTPGRSSHDRPKPRTGGVGVLCGCIAAALPTRAFPFGVVGVVFFAVGFLDDLFVARRGLRPWMKLLLQVAAGWLAAYFLRIEFAGEAVGPWPGLDFGVWARPLTVLWFVAVVNVVNFMDGIDGITAATCAVILCAAGAAGDPDSADVFLAGAGAVLGFAAWNAPPSKIILGDGGSHLLGFLVAAGACVPAPGKMFGTYAPWHAAPWALVGAPLVPSIVDVVEGLVHKMRHGIPMSRPHNDHLYQRLVKAGFGHGAVALRYGALAVAAVVIAGPVASAWGRVPALALGGAVLGLHLWTGARATKGVPRPVGP